MRFGLGTEIPSQIRPNAVDADQPPLQPVRVIGAKGSWENLGRAPSLAAAALCWQPVFVVVAGFVQGVARALWRWDFCCVHGLCLVCACLRKKKKRKVFSIFSSTHYHLQHTLLLASLNACCLQPLDIDDKQPSPVTSLWSSG